MPISRNFFFSDDRDDPVTVIDSHSSAQINDCVTANTSEKVIDSNQSQVTLYLKLASENCIKNIQDGKFYLRGVCMASNSFGTTSETFVLGVMSPTNDYEQVILLPPKFLREIIFFFRELGTRKCKAKIWNASA